MLDLQILIGVVGFERSHVNWYGFLMDIFWFDFRVINFVFGFKWFVLFSLHFCSLLSTAFIWYHLLVITFNVCSGEAHRLDLLGIICLSDPK